MTQPSLPRLWRTVRHLRSRQAVAQVRHALTGHAAPVALAEPPRFVASAVEVPFLPAPPHARWDGGARVELLNEPVEFPHRIEWDHAEQGPLWSYHLHQFDFARRPDVDPAARAALLLDWIARHERGVGWAPHPTSLRIVSWTKLLLTPGALRLGAEGRANVERSLARQVATLAGSLEVRLQANHLFSNLLGVVLGAIAFEGAPADEWLGHEAAFRRELARQIGRDGAHEERSPMYHALLLENLLDWLNVARSSPGRAPAVLVRTVEECAARMLGALAVYAHPDGEIALVGDSALGIAQPPSTLEAYGRALGVSPRPPERSGVLDAGGYVRLEARPFSLLASVGGPAPAHQPGHAHCDALAFELCVRGQRVVTDTGVYEYVPGPRRDAARATRSHATLEVGGHEQSEIWAAHRVGGRARVELVQVDPGRRAEGTCAGWATRDSLHRRLFDVSERAVAIRDTLDGRLRPVRWTLPLAPGLEPVLHADPAGENDAYADVALRGRETLRVTLPRGLRWSLETTPCFPEFGKQVDRVSLVGSAEGFRTGTCRFELLTD